MVSYKVGFANGNTVAMTAKDVSEFVAAFMAEAVAGLDCSGRRYLVPVKVTREEKGRKPVNVTAAVRAKLLGFTAHATETFARTDGLKVGRPCERSRLINKYWDRVGLKQKVLRESLDAIHQEEVRIEFSLALAAVALG